MMNRCVAIALGAGLLTLSACNGGQRSGGSNEAVPQDQGSLAGARIGGPFTLTDQDGRKRSWAEFKGRYRLVYFGYSYCPDVCPVDLQRIMQGFRLFAKKDPARAAKIQPIFISVDPQRDTPALLKNYVSAFDPHLIGLTGTPEEIAAVAKDFVVVYSKVESKGASEYLVSHSRTPYIFDPDGAPLALIPVDDPATPDRDEGSAQEVATALDHWVK